MSYGTDIARLRRLSLDELQERRVQIETDPANRQSTGLWLYTPRARRRLELIARAIAEKVAQARKERAQ